MNKFAEAATKSAAEAPAAKTAQSKWVGLAHRLLFSILFAAVAASETQFIIQLENFLPC